MVWNESNFFGKSDAELTKSPHLDVGGYDPWLGLSYPELAADSRSNHRSQGFGAARRRGPTPEAFHLLAGEPMKDSRPGRGDDGLVARPRDGTPRVRAEAGAPGVPDRHPRGRPSRPARGARRAAEAARESVEAGEARGARSGGARLRRALRRRDRGPHHHLAWRQRGPHHQRAAPSSGAGDADLGTPRRRRPWRPPRPSSRASRSRRRPPSRSRPTRGSPTRPGWTRRRRASTRCAIQALAGLPEEPAPLEAELVFAFGSESISAAAAGGLQVDRPVLGERYRRLEVLPLVTVDAASGLLLFPDAAARPLDVTVRSVLGASGTLTLELPAGFSAEPASAPFTVRRRRRIDGPLQGDSSPRGSRGGRCGSWPRWRASGTTAGCAAIDHPHIPIQTWLPPADGAAHPRRRGPRAAAHRLRARPRRRGAGSAPPGRLRGDAPLAGRSAGRDPEPLRRRGLRDPGVQRGAAAAGAPRQAHGLRRARAGRCWSST